MSYPARTLAFLILLAPACSLAGQEPDAPVAEPGARVRVTVGREPASEPVTLASRRVTGTLLGRDGDRLVVRDEHADLDLEIPVAQVKRLEVWRGREGGGGFLKGAAVGAGGALAGGLLLAPVSGGLSIVGALFVGVPIGAVAGGLIGSGMDDGSWARARMPGPDPPPG